MAVSAGLGFDLDDVVKKAEQADKVLEKMVDKSAALSQNMREAFSVKDTGAGMSKYIRGLQEMQDLLLDMSGKKLSINVDESKLEQAFDILGRISQMVDALSKGNMRLFNTQGLYESTQGLFQAEDTLEMLEAELNKLRQEWQNKRNAAILGDADFSLADEQKIKDQVAYYIELIAKSKEWLKWEKMTQDERVAYVQKKVNEILKAEQKNIAQIQKEYKSLWTTLARQDKEITQVEKASQGKTMNAEEQSQYDTMILLRQETWDKIVRMESQYQDQLTDITLEKTRQRASKELAERMKSQQYSAQQALAMARSARTGNEMETAKNAVKQALMTVDKDDLGTIERLNAAYINLRSSIEKLTKAQQNEQTLQPSIRNEYRRILKEIDDLAAAKERLAKTDAYRGLHGVTQEDYDSAHKAMQDLETREQDLINKRVEYEKQAGTLLDEVVRENAARQANIRLKEFEEADRRYQENQKKYGTISSYEAQSVMSENYYIENVRKSQRAVEELKEARDKLDYADANYESTLESLNRQIKLHEDHIQSVTNAEKHRAEQERQYRETYDGAKDYARQAKSLSDLKKAMDYLEKARAKEDVGSEKYQELSIILNNTRRRYEEFAGTVQRSSRGLINTVDQLKRGFALLFSVSQVRGYVRQLMKVRGEFELQQRSLQALLQNKEEADQLWNKTVALAVQSPFRVKELVAYTKQLAAYRFESDKLYDTTKMLADVSSGLGVDMQRLILAYGQVRSASYLKGTELRQFTEAGLPLLKELADRFTDLEGRAVSVGDVFERISKRMVTFEDVEAVFRKMTSEGEMFYMMQEKQSETLQGQISNLRDSVDLMLNDIGKSTEGALKGSIAVVRSLVENWQVMAGALKGVAAALVVYKVNAMLTDKALIRFAISQGMVMRGSTRLTKVLGLATAGFKKMFLALKSGLAINPWLLALTALLKVIMDSVSWFNRFDEALAEQNQRYYDQIAAVNKVTKAYDALIAAEKKEGANAEEIFAKKQKQLNELQKIAEERGIELSFELGEIDQENIDAIVEQIREDIIWAEDWGREFGLNLARGLNAVEGLFHIFGDNLATDLEELDEVMEKINRQGTKTTLANAENEILARYDELPDKAKEYFDVLREGRKENESEQAFLERRINTLSYISQLISLDGLAGLKNAKELGKAYDNLAKIARKRKEVEEELTEVVEDQLEAYGVQDFSHLTTDQQANVQLQIDKKFSDMQISDELKRWGAMFMAQEFQINYVVKEKAGDVKPLQRWQEEYNKFIKDFETGQVKNLTDAETTREKAVQELEGLIKEQQFLVDAFEKGGSSVNQAEYDEARKILEELNKAKKWIEGNQTKKGEKNKSLERLKEQVKLLKEMNQEYEKNLKFMDAETAEKTARKAYSATASKLGIDLSKGWNNNKIEGLEKEIDKVNELKDVYQHFLDEGLSVEAAKAKFVETYGKTQVNAWEEWIEELKAVIRDNEGFREEAYKSTLYDDKGNKIQDVWTFGYGFIEGVQQGDRITKEEAEKRLDKEVRDHTQYVIDAIEDANMEINKNQFLSLADLRYQTPPATVQKIIREAKGDMEYIAKALETAGTTIKGKYIPNLQGRADDRVALFSKEVEGLTLKEGQSVEDYLSSRLDSLETRLEAEKKLKEELEKLKPFSDEGTIKALEDMLAKAKNYDEYMEIAKTLDNYRAEILNDIAEKKQEALQKDVDEIFDMVELTKELKKLGFSEELAETFGFEFIDLDDARTRIEALKADAEKLGDKGVEIYDKASKQITALENKAMEERMKTYSKYLLEGMSERVKLKIEEMRKLKEIEEADEFTPEQKERITQGVNAETRKALQKQEWEDFKGSEMYTLMFEDIEYLGSKALNVLQDKLESLKGSLSDLDASEVKEIIGQINKIEDVMIERNPFAYMKDLREELKTMKSEEEYQLDLFNAQQSEEDAQGIINTIDIVQQKLAEGALPSIAELDAYNALEASAKERGLTLEDIKAEQKEIIKNSQKDAQVAQGGLNTYKRVRKTLQEQSDAWGEIGGKISEVFNASKELMTALGVSTDSVAYSLVESAQGMSDLIVQAVQFGLQMEIVGYQSNMALGVIGWILIAIQAIAKIISAIVGAKDAQFKKNIEDHQKAIEKLQKTYEDLEEKIDEAWSVEQIRAYRTEMNETYKEELDHQKAIVAAYEDHKKIRNGKTDSDKYKEYEEELEKLKELEEAYAETEENIFSKMTGGVLDNVLDVTRNFVDAWYDAFKETGDGLKGLEENFDELFLNLVKQQAAMAVSDQFVAQWKKMLQGYADSDGDGEDDLTTDEVKTFAEKVRKDLPELSKLLEAYFEEMGDLESSGGGSLTALQKGIQGITAEQSEVIQSLLNSLRYYVASSNEYAREQATYIKKLYSFFEGIGTAAHSSGGRGLKVVI